MAICTMFLFLPVTGDDHELIIWFITIRNDAVGYTNNRGGGVFQWCHFVCFCFFMSFFVEGMFLEFRFDVRDFLGTTAM
jgi:hypothetical protein